MECAPMTRSGSITPIWRVMVEPQSPPYVPYRSYPSRSMSCAQAAATRLTPHPSSPVGPENPKPGIEGATNRGWAEIGEARLRHAAGVVHQLRHVLRRPRLQSGAWSGTAVSRAGRRACSGAVSRDTRRGRTGPPPPGRDGPAPEEVLADSDPEH